VHNAKNPYEPVLLAVTEQAKQAAQNIDRGNSAQAVSGVVQHAQEKRTVRPTGGEHLRDAGVSLWAGQYTMSDWCVV